MTQNPVPRQSKSHVTCSLFPHREANCWASSENTETLSLEQLSAMCLLSTSTEWSESRPSESRNFQVSTSHLEVNCWTGPISIFTIMQSSLVSHFSTARAEINDILYPYCLMHSRLIQKLVCLFLLRTQAGVCVAQVGTCTAQSL
jgi:hypothetical protein